MAQWLESDPYKPRNPLAITGDSLRIFQTGLNSLLTNPSKVVVTHPKIGNTSFLYKITTDCHSRNEVNMPKCMYLWHVRRIFSNILDLIFGKKRIFFSNPKFPTSHHPKIGFSAHEIEENHGRNRLLILTLAWRPTAPDLLTVRNLKQSCTDYSIYRGPQYSREPPTIIISQNYYEKCWNGWIYPLYPWIHNMWRN